MSLNGWCDRQWQDCAIISTWFKAAFSTFDQDILLQRLEVTYGFNGAVLQWLRSYVEDRMQSVHLNGSISRPHRVICGVPQGSILGAFVIYSLHGRHWHHRAVIWSEILTYTDDNHIYSSCSLAEWASLNIKVIDCIDVVDKWMASNRLMWNPSKSEFLWCSSPRRVLLLDQSAFVLRDSSQSTYHQSWGTSVRSSMLQCQWTIIPTDSSGWATTSCAG